MEILKLLEQQYSVKNNIFYFLAFIVLTIVQYLVYFFIDHSSGFSTIARLLLFTFSMFYFLKLTFYVKNLAKTAVWLEQNTSDGKGVALIFLVPLVLHILLVDFGGKILNDLLLKSDYKETVATIKECSTKGTDYCIYSYTVDNRYYEVKYYYDTNKLKLKKSEKITIVYYPKFPVLCKVKTDME